MWLKMPGAYPQTWPAFFPLKFQGLHLRWLIDCENECFEFCFCAAFGAGSRKRQRTASFPVSTASKHTCPVVNCGRVFDNTSLLEGHLKRLILLTLAITYKPFNKYIIKSCSFFWLGSITLLVTQPSILKDVPLSSLPVLHVHSISSPKKNGRSTFSQRLVHLSDCTLTCKYFVKELFWTVRRCYQVNLLTPDGHSSPQTYQHIVCFACPACYLFFNLRDECLQHMAAKNHFTESLPLNGKSKHTFKCNTYWRHHPGGFVVHTSNIIVTSLSL